MRKNKLLIVDDEELIIDALIRLIELLDLSVDIESTRHPDLAAQWLKTQTYDLLLTDQRMPHITGLDLITLAHKHQPEMQCLLMSGYTDFDTIVTAINDGQISGFIMKPWKAEDVNVVIKRALSKKSELDEINKLRNIHLSKNEDWIHAIHQLESEDMEHYRKQIKALTALIHAKDPELYAHSVRVSKIVYGIGTAMKLPQEILDRLEVSALVHDLGKVAIKDSIHYKNGSLDPLEYTEMKRHAQIGADILRDLEVDESIVLIIEQHHERVDGQGYPHGLYGDQIILEAKILSVADAYDALTSTRPYREGVSSTEAIKILESSIGDIFAAEVVHALIQSI